VGQAARRGTFEERKAQAIARREEQQRINREVFLQKQAERDAILDRDYTPPSGTETPPRRVGVIGHSGRRGSSIMLMAAMLAATAGIGPVMADDRKYR
jgi:hypothetical protein